MKLHRALPLLLSLPAATAEAHGGQPPIAYLSNPDRVGELADQSYTFHWIDTNQPIRTGTATIDFYYTEENPPTFSLGSLPPQLTGTPIVRGVRETDRTDNYVWDTRAVPAGTYWLWSMVNEPPTELGFAEIATFSPGLLSIAHPGDPVHPAIFVSAPDTPYRYADQHYLVRFLCLDPDRSGRVRLEATPRRDGTGLSIIADDLPAAPEGVFDWDTSTLAEGDWTLRATITDGRGLSFTSYSRYFLLIAHPSADLDAGVLDSGAPPPPRDAAVGAADAGGGAPTPEPEGCRCVRGPGGPLPWVLALLCLPLIRRRGRDPSGKRSGLPGRRLLFGGEDGGEDGG